MVRQIIIPSGNAFILHLPDNYIGQKVEVIAFTINEESDKVSENNMYSLENARKFFDRNKVNMTDFTFNRDEANER